MRFRMTRSAEGDPQCRPLGDITPEAKRENQQ